MKKKYYNFPAFIFLFLVMSACVVTAGTSGTDARAKDSADNVKAEDLSRYRPKFTTPAVITKVKESPSANPFTPLPGSAPTHHVNDRVEALVDTIAILNKSVRFAKGFRILAYSGMERKAAMDIRAAIVNRVPDERDYLQYKQPNFRLKIGDYFTRLEAQQVFQQIKDITPNAMIVADQINVK